MRPATDEDCAKTQHTPVPSPCKDHGITCWHDRGQRAQALFATFAFAPQEYTKVEHGGTAQNTMARKPGSHAGGTETNRHPRVPMAAIAGPKFNQPETWANKSVFVAGI